MSDQVIAEHVGRGDLNSEEQNFRFSWNPQGPVALSPNFLSTPFALFNVTMRRMTFSAGAARQEITPLIGTGLSGFIARLEPSNTIGSPLQVRAVVLSDGTRLAAIVQADLVGFGRWHVEAVRDFASSTLGIPKEYVLLSATHTHSGPGVARVRGCEVAPYAYQWELVEKIKPAMVQSG